MLPWAPADAATVTPPAVLVPATAQKLDAIEQLFDGVETDLVLKIKGCTDIITVNAADVNVHQGGTGQEPDTDYLVVEGDGGPTTTKIQFTVAPLAGYRFWGVVGIPV